MAINTALRLLEKYSNKYPGIWEKLEEVAKENNGSWDTSITYVPVTKVYPFIRDSYTRGAEAFTVASLASWRQDKQIFTFDKDLEELLVSQADSAMKIPSEVLKRLPYRTIFVKTQTREYDGFFVSIDTNVRKALSIRFTILKNGSDYPLYCPIDSNLTIEEALEVIKASIRDKFGKTPLTGILSDTVAKQFEEMPILLQLVLYICSINAEVKESDTQKNVYRKPATFQQIKDKRREVRLWECGQKTGEIIRRFKVSSANNHSSVSTGTGSPKRPHSRRAHYHHYWVGPRDSEERRLILKWLPPTFINAHMSDDNLPTINLVEK